MVQINEKCGKRVNKRLNKNEKYLTFHKSPILGTIFNYFSARKSIDFHILSTLTNQQKNMENKKQQKLDF
ncbi:MAG: hypothetical protein K0S24_3310 [Sphingobacterium sp.]|jgi:hypothetical protein|nr:hypothetical protein [Sphingobacterium sp.]